MSMTEQEVISLEVAKQELSTSDYLAKINHSPDIRAIHTKRCSWLSQLILLAEYGLSCKEHEASAIAPMTIEELRNMRGEPVYIHPYGWRICFGVEPADIHGGIEKVNFGNSCYLPLSGYGERWTPYRQKPKEETE